MTPKSRIQSCNLAELMIYQIALSIEDGILAFHGFGSPLVQIALHLAKRSHAPRLILVAGATYGVNPTPAFLTPPTNDYAVNRDSECHLTIDELFDLAASGRMGRMFLSGLQIDPWGNMNVTCLGDARRPTLKLPGGGGGGNLSCDAQHITIWTAAHRTQADKAGQRRYRLVNRCDFITSLGHRSVEGLLRKQLALTGQGPDCLITDLGVFDFTDEGHARLCAVYPDTTQELIAEHTEFSFPVTNTLASVKLPEPEMIEFIRAIDPMNIRQHEFSPADRQRSFQCGG